MPLSFPLFAEMHENPMGSMLNPVIVKGNVIQTSGQKIDCYGLFAYVNESLLPIPFQIDKVDTKGKLVMTKGNKAFKDKKTKIFDANDELVFMAKDAGFEIRAPSKFPESADSCSKILISGRNIHEKNVVYLMTFPSAPEKSKIDYVHYDPDKMEISTENYSGKFNRNFPVASRKYAFEKGLGGSGEDLIDRVKVRVLIDSFGIKIKRTEEDIKVLQLGYIDGPVRAVVRTKNVTPLVFGIPASTTIHDTYYYDTYADYPFAVSMPIKPPGLSVSIIADFVNKEGWTFYNSHQEKGIVIDGKMDAWDQKMNQAKYRAEDPMWGVLTKDDLSFWYLFIAPPLCPVEMELYYNDDKNFIDESEDVKGEYPAIGINIKKGWKKMKENSVEFRIVHFYTRGYRKGMERYICDVYGHPLNASSAKL